MIETTGPDRDEFYIGYEEQMPPGIARRVVVAVAVVACVALFAVGIALIGQQTLAPSRFEFGVIKPVAGVLRRAPYPWLEVDGRRLWLAGPGKFGAEQILRGVPDGPVTVQGSAIDRGTYRMLELALARSGSGPIRVRPDPGLTRSGSDPEVALTGEIVDSKCFLGVMNPGEGTVHRDCARRCLSGGLPPMLLVRDANGREQLVVLVSSDGRPIGRELAHLAGRPIRVTGRMARDGEDYILYADVSDYRPAP